MNWANEKIFKLLISGLIASVIVLSIIYEFYPLAIVFGMFVNNLILLAIIAFSYSIYYQRYKNFYHKIILTILIVTIILFPLSLLLHISYLNFIGANLGLFLTITGFVYAFYILLKWTIKDITKTRDERSHNNFSRATRNAYIFLIVTMLFVPISSIISSIDPNVNITLVRSALIYVSILIAIVSFVYYDRLGK